MKIIKKIKDKGFKNSFQIFWKYKVNIMFEKIILFFTKNKKLKDKILIESHNDFDCNGGAFYEYLIENEYNKRYKIVWLVRKKVKNKLPKNVTSVPLYGPSIRKAYHMCTSKYISFDCESGKRERNDQIIVYCGHGACSLKNVRGKLKVSDKVDYYLTPSKNFAPIMADQYEIEYPNEKMIYIGYPAHDLFFKNDVNEIEKITNKKFKKIILWMPTFRKGGGYKRNDSFKEQKLGIPLFDTIEEFNSINNYLKEKNTLLIIKIHPKQDLSNLGIFDLSNIVVLTGDKVKKLKIDNYRLMKSSDALLSDYSSVACEFLLLDRPIGYVLDDYNEFKSGFIVKDIHSLMAGDEIYNLSDFKKFITNVVNNNDKYSAKRKKLKDYIFENNDGTSSKQLVDILGLKK